MLRELRQNLYFGINVIKSVIGCRNECEIVKIKKKFQSLEISNIVVYYLTVKKDNIINSI